MTSSSRRITTTYEIGKNSVLYNNEYKITQQTFYCFHYEFVILNAHIWSPYAQSLMHGDVL